MRTIKPRKGGVLFSGFFQFAVFKRLVPHLTIAAIYSALVVWLARNHVSTKAILEADSALCLGVMLGLLLVFRTNSSYDRWWEARRQWGQLVNDSRNLCIKFRDFWHPNEPERDFFGGLVIEFAASLRSHLRRMDSDHRAVADITHVLDDIANGDSPGSTGDGANADTNKSAQYNSDREPVDVAEDIYDFITEGYAEGKIDGFAYLSLDVHARAFMDILGACERIALSPITIAHKSLILHIIVLYVGTLPWCLANSLGYGAVLFTVIGAYVVLGLESIAEGKEQPFGTKIEDLPLEKICATIDKSVHGILDTMPESALKALQQKEAVSD